MDKDDSRKLPLIVDIKQNSLDDGPGIRSVIFFKGCPLSCVWCQNPETQNPLAELIFQPDNCIHCRPCTIECPNKAFLYDNSPKIDRNACKRSFNCVNACPANVFKKAGKYYEISELVEQLKSNKVFYDNTGGGVTLSGGEPLMYPNYTRDLIENLKRENINRLIETCGFFKINDDIDDILKNTDIIYFDIKFFDTVNHKKYCGVDNKIILNNFKAFINKYGMILPRDKSSLEIGKKNHENTLLIPRIPLVPDVTMTTSNLEQIRDFLKENDIKLIDLLQYNPLWIEKSKSLGVIPKYSRTIWMQHEELHEARKIFKDFIFVSFK